MLRISTWIRALGMVVLDTTRNLIHIICFPLGIPHPKGPRYTRLNQPSEKLIGARHVQSLMLFLCLTLAYAFRVNMSVGIVAITDNKSNPDFKQHDWDKKTQGFVLSSFFWGYVVSQVPAGYLGARYGPKYLVAGAMFMNSAFCLLTPIMAEYAEAWGVIGCRIIQGLSQGFFFPSMHTLLAKWVPPCERARLATFVYAGCQFGTVIALPASAQLAGTKHLGWPSIFYAFGIAGILWSILWFFLGANNPSSHRTISADEKKYIESSLGTDPHEKNVKTPWLAIFTSLPMWSLIIAHCGQNWGFWTLLTEMPTYLKNVFHFDMKNNGNTSALPYLVMWLLSFAFSAASDYLVNRQIIRVVVARKIGNSIGHWVPAIALIALGYTPSDQPTVAVALLTIAVGFNAATFVGFQVNHIDLAPRHAGIMMGITNASANVFSIVAPLVVGLIVSDDSDDVGPWRTVFFISAAIYFLFNLFFVIFGSADVQPWNDIEEKEQKDVEAPVPHPTNETSTTRM